MPIATGTRLGRYEIRSIIGAGGMGEVYLAHDTQLERTVAVKVLPIKLAENQEKTKRFIQEAKTASALNHPNIITIHDIGEENSLLYIATEFIDGATLRDLMQTRPLELPEVLDISSQVASALVVAHGAGIIHRDIKPENIMVRRDGYAKVLDFGLCKLMEEPTETSPHSITLAETDPNVVMGTPSYMSPEQVRGLQLDGRTDIWSLGTVIYEMLTGHKAFTGPTTSDIIVSVLEREPAPVSYFTRNSSEALEWIVNKCLRKDCDERYQTIKEVFADLRSLKNRLQSGSDLSGGEFVRSTSNSFSNGLPAAAFTGVAGKAQKTLLSTRQIEIDTGKVSAANQTHSGLRRFFTGVKNSATNPLWLGIVVVLLLSGLMLEVYRFGIPFGKNWRGGLFQQSIKTAKLTTTGTVTRVAISPDGKYLVQATSDGSKQSLWVKQVATTSNVEIIPADEVIYRGLTFSHDGNYIFYVVQEGNNPTQALYQIPVLGGAPRKILTKIDSPVTVSPDNSQLAFVRRDRADGTDALIVAAVDGSTEKTLTVRRGSEFFSINGPAWSPDGKVIVNGSGTREGGRSMNLLEARVADGQEKIISNQKWFDINRVAWIQDESGLMISAVEQNSSQSQVWQISYPDGQARKLTNDFNDYRDMSLTSDSNSLVAVQSEARVNVWTSPVGAWDRVKQITTGIGEYDGVRGLCWMPDGRLVYVSRVSGSQDVWIMNGNGTEKKQLTTVATRADVDPSVPQDGRFIVFTSNRAGNSNIWRIDPDGGNPKQLTKGSGEEFPNVSPDGQTVVYTSTVTSKFTLWKVSSDGGEPVQLTDKLSQWPVVSPDGKTVACWYREEAKSPWQIALLPIEGGAPLYVFDVTPTAGTSIPVRWSADGKSITYIDTREGVSNIWSQAREGGAAPRKVTDFKSGQMFWFDWSRDGKNFTCARGSVTSDAILISGFRR